MKTHTQKKMTTVAVVVALLFMATPLFAHVSVAPRESKLGATENYSFRVPSEGGMATTSVVLDVPDGVTIMSVNAPEGAKHEEKKTGDRITQVTWTVDIKPGASATLAFVAKNPTQGDSIAWKVHQKYSDGMSSDWTGAAGSRNPAPVTKLVAADKH